MTEPVEQQIIIDDSLIDTIVDNLNTEQLQPEEKKEESIQRPQQKVTVGFSYVSDEKPNNKDSITLPSNFDKETRQALERMPNIDILDNPEARQWAETVSKGLELSTYDEVFVPTLEDQDSSFNNKNEHNGVSLNPQPPKFKAVENQNLKGERAVIRVISHLGLGTLFQVPLWHSGLWITFKPPTETEIVELNRILISDKIKFGRYSYGLTYSNITSYTTDRLVDFAIQHMYDITAKTEDITIDNVKNHISCQDLPSLLWGFICTMYPKGFNYRRACVNDPDKCNHIVEETLNVSKLQWPNMNALTDWQKTHMTGRQSKVKDLTSINRYKEELSRTQKKKILINADSDRAISITIKTPSLTEHIDAGHRWIGDIVETVDKTLGADAKDKERDNIIIRYGQASAMRQYSHWVESIEYETNIIDDKETIENTLNVLSSDDEVRSKFITSVVEYINKSTIAVVGIPVYDCPKCNTTQTSSMEHPEYKNVIPLDVMQLFFDLLTQRLSNLIDR
jgi:hypothetical protein